LWQAAHETTGWSGQIKVKSQNLPGAAAAMAGLDAPLISARGHTRALSL
jgi:hypothetical protein